MRIVITGSPLSGKTTLANVFVKIFGLPLLQTDSVKHMEWSESSEHVSHWFNDPRDGVIEGVTVPRALRKWQKRNPDQPPPFDWFIILPHPRQFLGSAQETMRKQIIGLAETQKEWIGERWIEL